MKRGARILESDRLQEAPVFQRADDPVCTLFHLGNHFNKRLKGNKDFLRLVLVRNIQCRVIQKLQDLIQELRFLYVEIDIGELGPFCFEL